VRKEKVTRGGVSKSPHIWQGKKIEENKIRGLKKI